MPTVFDLRQQALKAIAANRAEERELRRFIDETFDRVFNSPDEEPSLTEDPVPHDGKVAEATARDLGAEDEGNMGAEPQADLACPVNPNTTNTTTPTTTVNPNTTNTTTPTTTENTKTATERTLDLLKREDVRKLVAQSRAHTKRLESRRDTIARRTAMPTTPWKRATADDKFRYAGHAAEASNGNAFTLNLSGPVQRHLKTHANPLRAFTDTLNRELKKRGLSGLPYALTLEESSSGKLHVHGLTMPHNGTTDALRDALRAAGGLIGGRAGSRQLTIRKLSGAAGWAFYCRKDLEETDRVLAGEARLFLNRAMTQAAREFALSVRQV
ncbi:hypothetical protein [uncultured Maritimibacter sp.]|jgi:hypothetical protein|uniref:hypothetical protein n=1 Tax=uncultured Maritimibacter sp. TaxID=991866 RepID=UPI00260256BB|nr:hypothetical protein [uncultured Maritimibacter sp.]